MAKNEIKKSDGKAEIPKLGDDLKITLKKCVLKFSRLKTESFMLKILSNFEIDRDVNFLKIPQKYF